MQISNFFHSYNKNMGLSEPGDAATIAKADQGTIYRKGELTPGAIFEGVVSKQKNGNLVLTLGNGETLNAKLGGNVNLNVGQSVFFEVEGYNESNQILIHTVMGESAGNPAILKALSSAGLPNTTSNILMVQTMMENNLPISREALTQMARNLLNYPETSVSNLALMSKLGIQIQRDNVAMMENYTNDRHQMLHTVNEMMQGVGELLKDPELSAGRAFLLAGNVLETFAEGLSEDSRPVADFVQTEEVETAFVSSQNETTEGMTSNTMGAKGPATVGEALTQAFQEISNLFENKEEGLGTLTQTADHLAESKENLTQSAGNLTESTGDLTESTGNLTESTGDFTQSTGDLTKPTGNLIQSTGDLTQSGSNLTESTGDLTQSIGNLTEGARLEGAFTAGENEISSMLSYGQMQADVEGTTPYQNPSAYVMDFPEANRMISISPMDFGDLSMRLDALSEEFPEFSQLLDKDGMIKPELTTRELLGKIGQVYQEFSGQIAENGLSPDSLKMTALKNLFSSQGFQKLLTDTMEKEWMLQPEEVFVKDKVKGLYERLDQQMARFQELFEKEDSPVASKLAQNASSVRSNISFMNDINQMYSYVQIPLKMTNENAHSDLYVYSNKKNLRDGDGTLSAFLSLDMKHLGKTNVYVEMEKGNRVTTNFYLENTASFDLIMKHMDELSKRITDRGYPCTIHVKNEEKPMDFVEDFLKQGENVGSVHRYSFDVMA